MIASVLLLAPRMGLKLEEQVFGLAIGVVVAGLAQAVFQMPGLRREGFRYAWVTPWHDPTVREVVVKMIPGSIGVAAFQINVLVTQSFSYWFEPTIVSTFNYSVRLMELPQGLFGISLATFLLPTLSGLAADKKFPEFQATLKQGLSYLSLANLFAAAMALALAVPIVRLLFERGEFDAAATYRVALALACLAPGLLLFSMNNILARAFYALKDIQTPMKISLVCLALNLVFALWLVRPYREAGLAVANTLSAGFNTALLLFALRKKLARLEMAGLPQTVFTLVGAAAVAGAVGFGLYHFWDARLGHANLAVKFGAVFVPAALAGAVYWLLAMWAKVPAAKEMSSLIGQRGRRRK
ncbi:MAG: lipid II flippase MurJ [Verrucomicrobiota bacterium]